MKVKTIQSQTGVLEEYQFSPQISSGFLEGYTLTAHFLVIVLQMYTLTYTRATGVLG